MINTNVNLITYKGDGKTKEFPIPFPYIDKENIVVYLVKDDVETLLTDDYYIDSVDNKLIYPGYAPGEEKTESEQPEVLPEGSRLIITRDIEINQEKSLGRIWPFTETEKGLDKLTLIAQDMKNDIKYSVKLPETAKADGFEATLPYPEKNTVFGWDALGKKIISYKADITKDLELSRQKIIKYATVDNMKKDAALIPETTCLTLGCYKENDGGGALYKIRKKKTNDISDNITLIALNNGNMAELIYTLVTRDTFFEIDENGALMPSEKPMFSFGFELDVNGDIMPKGE